MLEVTEIGMDEHDSLARLLTDNAMLARDLAGENKLFFAFIDDSGWRIGVGGLELYGRDALLRSLFTMRCHRGQGLGSEMVARLLVKARDLSVHNVYLFTETAQPFFEKQGFTPCHRDHAPAGIRSSAQYRIHCGGDAAMMVYRLVSH